MTHRNALSPAIRLYGNAPYTLVLLHGGPGARGSLAGAARQLGRWRGVAEPLQTGYSVEENLAELHAQLKSLDKPVTLAGHSWGAWLALLYAAQFAQEVKHLVLISCPPLQDSFVPLILQRRLSLLSPEEATAFCQALQRLETNTPPLQEDLETVEWLSQKTDFVEPCDYEDDALEIDARQYQQVWAQAARMRTAGKWVQAAQKITCPVSVLHGRQDPHPIQGVLEPLRACGIHPQVVLWDRCSHSPFAEKHAQAAFYRFLRQA